MRGSALADVGMSEFIVRTAVHAAQDLIDKSERMTLSRRDSLRILDLIEHPPKPNAKLLRAARRLPPLA